MGRGHLSRHGHVPVSDTGRARSVRLFSHGMPRRHCPGVRPALRRVRATLVTSLEPDRIVRLEEGPPPRSSCSTSGGCRTRRSSSCARRRRSVAEAIRTLAVRGAPAIGVAAAYGMALAALRGDDLAEAERVLAASRPTAVNLFWALDADARRSDARAGARAPRGRGRPLPAHVRARRRALRARNARAHALQRRRARDRRLRLRGRRAPRGVGARPARAACSSTRRGRCSRARASPRGSSRRLGIPHAVIADSAAASMMARGEVDLIVTGADRIAANGDTANKIGTYSLAVLAAASRHPALRRRADVDRRPRDGRPAPRSRSRSATPPRSRRASPRATPRSTSRPPR